MDIYFIMKGTNDMPSSVTIPYSLQNAHPTVVREYIWLKERFPTKTVLGLNEYAKCMDVSRGNASRHIKRLNAKKNTIKLIYEVEGKKYRIKFEDFARWKVYFQTDNGEVIFYGLINRVRRLYEVINDIKTKPHERRDAQLKLEGIMLSTRAIAEQFGYSYSKDWFKKY